MYRVGVDIGGTFTDLVALSEDGELINIKVSSTPLAPEKGVVEALREFLAKARPDEIEVVVHATTIATNALLGQRGLELPKAALITTKGFRDIIEIGRQRRHRLYDLFFTKPRPLVERRYRYEVAERIGPRGEVIAPLNSREVEDAVEDMLKEGVKTVAIGFLNSYVNPAHELEAKRIVKEKAPSLHVTASCEISPEYREYERISTAVVNSVLKPIVSLYVRKLEDELRSLGVKAPLYVMQSNGGMASPEVVSEAPVTVVESGPAAGVIAAAFYSKALGISNVISFDMGGTTAKAGSIFRGAPEQVAEYEVAGEVHKGRVVKGSGYPVRFPFIDLVECSAGGGTIAWVDKGGALRVGPVSAGADPGPACYGQGGEDPTITDANLLLGRLNPRYLLGGRKRVYRELAEKAFKEKVCDPLGVDLTEAATAVIEVANTEMSKILRIVSVERGYDPRDFSMIAFGGAGPMHACALAEELGVKEVIIPLNPGLFSALGLLAADFQHDFTRAVMSRASELEPADVEELFRELEERGVEVLEEEGVSQSHMVFTRKLDLRYIGQAYELTVPASRPFDRRALEQAVEAFHSKHEEVYGYAAREEEVYVVNARVTAVGLVRKPKLKKVSAAGGSQPPAQALIEEREVYFSGGYERCRVYQRERLKPGNVIEGPAVIEQYDSTTVVHPGFQAAVDELSNLILRRC